MARALELLYAAPSSAYVQLLWTLHNHISTPHPNTRSRCSIDLMTTPARTISISPRATFSPLTEAASNLLAQFAGVFRVSPLFVGMAEVHFLLTHVYPGMCAAALVPTTSRIGPSLTCPTIESAVHFVDDDQYLLALQQSLLELRRHAMLHAHVNPAHDAPKDKADRAHVVPITTGLDAIKHSA